MANLAPAPPPETRPQLAIQRPSTSALDSSDEARTDTSTSPSMNPARSPASDATLSSTGGPAAASAATPSSSSSSCSRRRKADSAAAAGDDKPAPKQRKYERKTKRFIWPDDLHRLFVAAIFDGALVDLGFLEYYDRSAKRNLKRRRRQAQHRASGTGGEANTMFVFPISNSKRRKGHASDSDSDDSDSDTGDSNNNDNRMDVDAKGHGTPQGRRGSPAPVRVAQSGALNYSQLMQGAQQQSIIDGNSHLRPQPHITDERMMSTVPTPVSTGLLPIAPQHLPPAYAAAHARKNAEHDRDLAAAAAAVAAYRYPLGQLPVGAVPGMPELSDPQWSIINSLMSPQLAGMTGPVGEGGIFSHPPQVSTSEAVARGTEGFMLHEEPTDLQMQMHLAMQAQMNLHRQMLTRKVEVAQHLARHSSMGNIGASAVTPSANSRDNPQTTQRGFNESWGSSEQLQQQQYQQQQQQHFQQHMNMLSRPSLSGPTSAPQTANASTNAIATAPATSEAMPVSASTTEGQSTGPPATGSSATGLATDSKSEDDGMDLYRWDRIDLNVELDDDDLFGFLKS
ncbi:unnamed protein product [Phytophthora fragariaefolia]|uniref:Unnamed protein product n=1 Tax=Phytophthora fragariaefolia TaxID=1490495 RepID=A0A9W7CJM1_9STRA|nr:unnamed protein product [Phytophthora fragariaefolia]